MPNDHAASHDSHGGGGNVEVMAAVGYSSLVSLMKRR